MFQKCLARLSQEKLLIPSNSSITRASNLFEIGNLPIPAHLTTDPLLLIPNLKKIFINLSLSLCFSSSFNLESQLTTDNNKYLDTYVSSYVSLAWRRSRVPSLEKKRKERKEERKKEKDGEEVRAGERERRRRTGWQRRASTLKIRTKRRERKKDRERERERVLKLTEASRWLSMIRGRGCGRRGVAAAVVRRVLYFDRVYLRLHVAEVMQYGRWNQTHISGYGSSRVRTSSVFLLLVRVWVWVVVLVVVVFVQLRSRFPEEIALPRVFLLRKPPSPYSFERKFFFPRESFLHKIQE